MSYKDRPYWLNGGIVALIVCLIPMILFTILEDFLNNFFIQVYSLIFLMPGFLIMLFTNSSLLDDICMFNCPPPSYLPITFMWLYSTIIYILIGMAIGQLYGGYKKIKNKNNKTEK